MRLSSSSSPGSAVRRKPYSVILLDEVVVFRALDEKHIKSIARIQLGYLEKRLAQLEMKLEPDDSALSEVANADFDPVFGARPLKRAIQAQTEKPLAKAILEGRFAAGDTIRATCQSGVMRFEKGEESAGKRLPSVQRWLAGSIGIDEHRRGDLISVTRLRMQNGCGVQSEAPPNELPGANHFSAIMFRGGKS